MNIILFDSKIYRDNLLPFTYTRPIADIRCGILKISEKWHTISNKSISFLTEKYLSVKFPAVFSANNYYINGAVLPTIKLWNEIVNLPENTALIAENILIAYRSSEHITDYNHLNIGKKLVVSNENIVLIQQPWEIFTQNGNQIIADFKLITESRVSERINDTPTISYNLPNIFIEEGVKIRAAVLNAEDGPIYIGKNCAIQEGSLIKGPFAMCEGAVINMGGKMRQHTTIGPFSKVGGEISNSVIFGYSNKAHDGFLGNSVVGEWCNLGADTNTSNLKNNYSNVKIWNMASDTPIDTKMQFCGLMMGDHSKTGINTMLNTGTVAGVASNIFGGGFPPKNIPCFSWGGESSFETYQIEKAFETSKIIFERRKKVFDTTEKDILKAVFELTKTQRNFK